MLRSVLCLWPFCAVAAFSFFLAFHALSTAEHYMGMAREFREDFQLFSGLAGASMALSGAFITIGMLCWAAIRVIGNLSRKLLECENRITRLEEERKRDQTIV